MVGQLTIIPHHKGTHETSEDQKPDQFMLLSYYVKVKVGDFTNTSIYQYGTSIYTEANNQYDLATDHCQDHSLLTFKTSK